MNPPAPEPRSGLPRLVGPTLTLRVVQPVHRPSADEAEALYVQAALMIELATPKVEAPQ